MPGGRPTKYNAELLERAKQYLVDFDVDGIEIMPTIQGLSNRLDISDETINEWTKDPQKSEFSATVRQIKFKQHAMLLKNGLDGTYNPTIAKLALASNHGYSEKTQTEHSGQIDSTVTTVQRTIVDPKHTDG